MVAYSNQEFNCLACVVQDLLSNSVCNYVCLQNRVSKLYMPCVSEDNFFDNHTQCYVD